MDGLSGVSESYLVIFWGVSLGVRAAYRSPMPLCLISMAISDGLSLVFFNSLVHHSGLLLTSQIIFLKSLSVTDAVLV